MLRSISVASAARGARTARIAIGSASSVVRTAAARPSFSDVAGGGEQGAEVEVGGELPVAIQ